MQKPENFKVGMKVKHRDFGSGSIIEIYKRSRFDKYITCKFNNKQLTFSVCNVEHPEFDIKNLIFDFEQYLLDHGWRKYDLMGKTMYTCMAIRIEIRMDRWFELEGFGFLKQNKKKCR